ncbi:MAG: T9SS type A sorting domain-containing protein, partial [Prolixibacteraceae bacterium]|nr:T9SS type A sorting domain-containing protein [Prolixibacteraceae bacterium]
RLRGNKFKPLKFIIMTSITAIIISAILFWPGKNTPSTPVENTGTSLELLAPEQQTPRHDETDSNTQFSENVEIETEPELKPIAKEISNQFNQENEAKSDILSVEDEMIAMANLNRYIIDSSDNSLMVHDLVKNEPTSIVAEPSGKEMPINFDIDTFEPVDGSKFVLKLSKEELEKIGFQVQDSLLLYENNINDAGYRFGKSRKRVYGELTNYTGYYIFETEISFEKTEKIQTTTNAFSFYPVYKSNMFYSRVMPNGTLGTEFFESANDTLLPIVFPNFDGDKEEVLLWFVVNNQLYDLISANHKPLLDEFLKLKTYKKKYPQKDFIQYRSPFLLDESKIMILSEEELEKIGFNFYTDSTVYSGKNLKCQLKIMLSDNNSYVQTMEYDDLQMSELNNGSLALFMTDKKGSPLFGSLGLFPILFPEDDEIFNQIPLLIPVEVNVSGNFESLIFWFLPNENFFSSISEEVSVDLQAEINYITAEDKSALIKPECTYYEECKNTLELTDFKVYPNPANYEVTVSFELPETIGARISLVDLTGREKQVLHPQSQFAAGRHQFNFDLSSVAEGMYLITLYSDQGVQTQRLMVVR